MEENNSSILVVDDNPEIQEIIQVLLGREGYLVETAGNGVKALEMLENREYDLIILDIMMPKPPMPSFPLAMSGWTEAPTSCQQILVHCGLRTRNIRC